MAGLITLVLHVTCLSFHNRNYRKSMRNALLLIMLSVGITCQVAGQSMASNGHDITITLKPIRNQFIYLGYYYGKIKALADSVLLDENSSGHFKGKNRLPGGI